MTNVNFDSNFGVKSNRGSAQYARHTQYKQPIPLPINPSESCNILLDRLDSMAPRHHFLSFLEELESHGVLYANEVLAYANNIDWFANVVGMTMPVATLLISSAYESSGATKGKGTGQ